MPNDTNPPHILSIFICESPQFDFWAELRAGAPYSPTTLICPRRQKNTPLAKTRGRWPGANFPRAGRKSKNSQDRSAKPILDFPRIRKSFLPAQNYWRNSRTFQLKKAAANPCPEPSYVALWGQGGWAEIARPRSSLPAASIGQRKVEMSGFSPDRNVRFHGLLQG
jgi:hypothetical protein